MRSTNPICFLRHFFEVAALLKVQVIQSLESSICIDKDNRADFEKHYVQ